MKHGQKVRKIEIQYFGIATTVDTLNNATIFFEHLLGYCIRLNNTYLNDIIPSHNDDKLFRSGAKK